MSKGEPLRCPNDGARLVELERSDVLIDACPQCRGVWLDRGELDKILVMERRMQAGPAADDDFLQELEGRRRGTERGPDYEDRPPDKRRRRRGFLEDLLDFD
jgi:uncharacterized protein